MTCSKAGASPAWPGVMTKASGRQPPSATRWIFVVSPPRDRPRAWSAGSPAGAPFDGPGGVLVCAHDGGVDRDHPVEVAFGVGLSEQGGEDLLPRAVGGPLPQPVVGALPRAEVLGQVHPRCASAVLERDRVDHLPVIAPPPTPPRGPVRQQRLDAGPLGVSQRHTQTNDPMIRKKRPSSTSLGSGSDSACGEWSAAGGAGAGPAPQQVLEDVEDLVEGQAGMWAFGSSRRRVRKAWAAVTRVTWWCQPRQVRPSKWSRPRPCLSSR